MVNAIEPARTFASLTTVVDAVVRQMDDAQRDAIKQSMEMFKRHDPARAKASTDADLVVRVQKETAVLLIEYTPQVITLAALEWIGRNTFAPSAGEWRGYCHEIADAVAHMGADGRDDRDDWRAMRNRSYGTQDATRARDDWRARMLPATRAYIDSERRRAEDAKEREIVARLEELERAQAKRKLKAQAVQS